MYGPVRTVVWEGRSCKAPPYPDHWHFSDMPNALANVCCRGYPLVDDAHHKVPPAGFKYLVTEMLCWAAGGPQKYTGKDMESSHRHLRITPGEWDAFMDDVAQTLDKFAVPAAERAEVVAIVESTRRSIIAA